MKNVNFNSTLLAALVSSMFFSCNNGQHTNSGPVENKTDSGLVKIISRYNEHIDSLQMQPSTVYLDGDFVRFLYRQLQAANNLAEMEIHYGKDKGLKEIATTIVKANIQHLSVLDDYMSVPMVAPGDSSFYKEIRGKLDQIDSINTNYNADAAFLSVMLSQEELTITMARIYIKYASMYDRKNENLINIARKIEAEKEAETKLLEQSKRSNTKAI